MLPPGRPFVVELTNPKRTRFSEQQFQELQESVNRATKRVQIRHFQRVSKCVPCWPPFPGCWVYSFFPLVTNHVEGMTWRS